MNTSKKENEKQIINRRRKIQKTRKEKEETKLKQ
jgi:hypothetical protein